MHSINFQLKRAHLQTVAFGERAVAKVEGMTAARFDLLYLLRRVAIERGPAAKGKLTGMTQLVLRERLGLHRSTVSKMLKRLEEMKWITREKDSEKKRTKFVRLTALGLRRIWRAMRLVFRQRVLLREYERLFGPSRPEAHVLIALGNVWGILRMIGRRFGDDSSVWYDYGQWEDAY